MNRRVGVILSYVFMIFEVLSTLLITPFIIRTLGQAEYGVYKLAASINAYLLLLDLGMGNAIVRYIAKYRSNNDKDAERKFFGVATLFYLVIAIIALVIGVYLVDVFPVMFSKGLLPDEIILGQKLLVITMINSAITLGTATFNNIIIAYEKFAISRGASIIQIILRMILTVIVLNVGMGSMGIVSVNLLMTIVCRLTFALYVLIKIRLKPKFRGLEIKFIKEIIVYSSFILLQMVATQINATADQILLGTMVSSSAIIIGIYGIGTQIVSYFQSIGASFTSILMPGIVKLVENNGTKENICYEMIRIGRIIFMVLGLVWVGFIVFGKEFVILWAGQENTDAYYVGVILMSAYLFYLVESVGTQVLWAKNIHKEQSILKIMIVITNIILTIILIKWNPLIGATIGTFLSIVLGDVIVMNIIFSKKLYISLKKYYKELLKGIAPCLCFSLVIGYFISMLKIVGWIALITKCLCLFVVYSILLIVFGMNSYEKNLLLSILHLNKIKFIRK